MLIAFDSITVTAHKSSYIPQTIVRKKKTEFIALHNKKKFQKTRFSHSHSLCSYGPLSFFKSRCVFVPATYNLHCSKKWVGATPWLGFILFLFFSVA